MKKWIYFGLTTLLSTIAVLGVSTTALAAPLTCSWTGGGSDSNFSTAANWSNCNGAAPVNGSNLVFDITNLNVDTQPNNDISNLSLGSITFTGTNAQFHWYKITGNDLSLSGGITDTTVVFDELAVGVTLTADQTFLGTQNGGGFGLEAPTKTLNIGNHTLTISGNGIDINEAIQGSGTIEMDGTLGFSPSTSLDMNSPNFSGNTQVVSGNILVAGQALGTGPVSVASGANIEFFPQSNSDTTETIPNNFTLSGSGIDLTGQGNTADKSGALSSCLDTGSGFPPPCNQGNANTNINLSGKITLTSNTQLGNYEAAGNTGAANFTLTGKLVTNGHTLTGVPNSNTTVINNATTVTSDSSPGANKSGSTTPAAPKSPDTGLAPIAANPWLAFAITSGGAIGLFIIAARFKTSRSPAGKK